jgi:hypothetical protein
METTGLKDIHESLGEIKESLGEIKGTLHTKFAEHDRRLNVLDSEIKETRTTLSRWAGAAVALSGLISLALTWIADRIFK